MLPRVVALVWVMLFVGAIWCAIIIVGMAIYLLRPRRMTDARRCWNWTVLPHPTWGWNLKRSGSTCLTSKPGKS